MQGQSGFQSSGVQGKQMNYQKFSFFKNLHFHRLETGYSC